MARKRAKKTATKVKDEVKLKGKQTEEEVITVLKDAIAQIRKGAYNVKSSTGFIDGNGDADLDERFEDLGKAACILGIDTKTLQVKDYIDKLINPAEPCQVCAKGAYVLSSIRKYNNFSTKEAITTTLDGEANNIARKLLGKKNADLIEKYFEHDELSYPDPGDVSYVNYHDRDEYKEDEEDKDAEEMLMDKWFRKYPGADDRLIAIFQNCIKNKGVFMPEQLK